MANRLREKLEAQYEYTKNKGDWDRGLTVWDNQDIQKNEVGGDNVAG